MGAGVPIVEGSEGQGLVGRGRGARGARGEMRGPGPVQMGEREPGAQCPGPMGPWLGFDGAMVPWLVVYSTGPRPMGHLCGDPLAQVPYEGAVTLSILWCCSICPLVRPEVNIYESDSGLGALEDLHRLQLLGHLTQPLIVSSSLYRLNRNDRAPQMSFEATATHHYA